MNLTKKIIPTILLFCFVAFTGYSQNSNDNELLENAKKITENVSEHIDINDDQKMLLYRAIYSYKNDKAKINSNEDMSENQKEEYLQKIESAFQRNVKLALDGNEQLKEEFFTYYQKE